MDKSLRVRKNIQAATQIAALVSSAIAPMFAVLTIRLLPAATPWLWVCIVITVAGLLGGLYLRYLAGGRPAEPKITQVAAADGEAITYVGSLLLPLVAATTPSLNDAVAYLAVTVVFVVILFQTRALAVNPVLYLLGIKAWKVKADTIPGGEMILLGRNEPREGESYAVLVGRFSLFEDRKASTT
ncbi:hypothetical protein [Agrococcus sp. Marseille-Q4369]|uniref:hypothetical protein n=1 Tax=Agrococcus sp. Marseille-Q4369 TaxID=2810513 RepID=UPI001B8BDE83|nr:hypothetical protein [Agrococcus sp. Marseille-Q4369]QUW18234.1 hypothetical protein JSQ78_10405 [Agrococcus sp. Marseille-Q4369]